MACTAADSVWTPWYGVQPREALSFTFVDSCIYLFSASKNKPSAVKAPRGIVVSITSVFLGAVLIWLVW